MVKAIERLGGEPVEIDFAPFLEAARLLYEGPWVAERYAAIRDFIERQPKALHPVTAGIIGGATRHSAIDTYAAYYRLKELQRVTAPVWDGILGSGRARGAAVLRTPRAARDSWPSPDGGPAGGLPDRWWTEGTTRHRPCFAISTAASAPPFVARGLGCPAVAIIPSR
jgi:hypothetical protein